MARTLDKPGEKRVAMYLRISKEDKRKVVSLGIEAQRSACLEAAASHGWSQPHEYCDMDVSGRRPPEKRPALSKLLTAMRNGEIDVIIVAALDRLSRKIIYTLTLREEINQLGVTLFSCRESFIDNTPVGNFMMHQMAALAQFEGEIISTRITAALREKRRIAGRPSGRLPYGYIWRDALIHIDLERVAIVRGIFRDHYAGVSMQRIADALNLRGVSAPYGREWYASTIHAILRNQDVYRGKKTLPAILTNHRQTKGERQ